MAREKTARFASTETFHVNVNYETGTSAGTFSTRFKFPTLARAKSFAETLKETSDDDLEVTVTRTVRPVESEHVITVA